MLMSRTSAAALVVLLGSGCAGDRELTTSDVLPIGSCRATPATDAYSLGEVSLDGELLVAELTSSGGCAAHTFAACWDGEVAKSDPPQVFVTLSHDAHGDPCDALLNHEVRIDLARIRADVPTPVIIHIVGATSQLAGTSNTVKLDD
jgi:hypothetical protein